MTGVKLGDRLLHVGCSEASLMAAIGSKVGLSGRVCAVVPDADAAARARRGAEDAGFLLELESRIATPFPFDEGAFDLIVVDNLDGMLARMRPEERAAVLRETFRLLAPRGRAIVIERAARGGFGGLFRSGAAPDDPQYRASGGAIPALETEGFRSARLLAERDGLSFFEGVR